LATFRQKVETAIPALRRYARALTRDADVADDLVQDTLVRALRSEHLFEGDEVRSWLYTILTNLNRNRLRSLARRPVLSPIEDNDAPDLAGPEAGGRDIERALATLVEEQRTALLLVVLEGLSYREVAEVQGVPIGTVMSRLARARVQIKTYLDGGRPALRVDGELPADRKEVVAAWLAEHPEQASIVASWRAQAEAIRARYGAIAEEAVPVRLDIDRIMRQGGGWRSVAAFAAAASVAAFVLGGGVGWFARGASATPSSFSAITTDALDAYRLYVVEVRHPVEVPGSERAHMTQWLSKRLGAALRVPDLESIGLKLIGGRLLPGPTGEAAAFYMYESASGERFTIYCAKASAPESALRYRSGDQSAAFYWVDNKIAYVVSGPADRDKLEKVSKTVYEQVDKGDARKS
jgi:RNA polymerase sigma factor (sigma-70 family)